MPIFNYAAADKEGGLHRGQMEAIDKKAILDFLKSENLLVVSLQEKSPGLASRISLSRKITNLDKINFTSNLATMIRAGVPLTESLDILAEETVNDRLKTILSDLKFSIENGQPLSEGLSHYNDEFNEVFVNLVRAGEASGKLDEVLTRLATQLKKEYALISKVKGALIYPAVLILGVLGVLVLIITFVIPRLATIFAGSGYNIPWTTRLLFFIARMASYNPYLTFGLLTGLGILAVFLLRQKTTKVVLNRLLFRLPITANLFKKMEQVRFCRTLSGLLSSGINIGKSMEITASGMTLPAYKAIVLDAREKIIKGVSLANAFRGQEKYFSRLLISVINVGEKTAKIDTLLDELADFYEEQTDASLKNLSGLIEPLLLVIVGLLIGGMAIAIIVPIYQLIGRI